MSEFPQFRFSDTFRPSLHLHANSFFSLDGVVVLYRDGDPAGDLAGERRDAVAGLRDPLRRLQPHPKLLRRPRQAQGGHGAARVSGT